MAGLVPAIHVFNFDRNSWMPGTSAGHDEAIGLDLRQSANRLPPARLLRYDKARLGNNSTENPWATPNWGRSGRSPRICQIYRPMLTMMMSIAHRISRRGERGRLPAARLVAGGHRLGPRGLCPGLDFFGSIPGRLLLFLFSWSLIHHMLGGIRHLIWDTGRGLDKVSIEIFAWATIIGSTVLTVLVWIAGYWLRGALSHGDTAQARSRPRRRPSRHRNLLAPAPDGDRQRAARHLSHSRRSSPISARATPTCTPILARPLVALGMLAALILSAAIHMRIGLKEIIEDYVHGGAKIVAILLATFFAVGVGLACLLAILKISLGS